MKKILVTISLILVLTLCFSTLAFASNGKGKGLATAPGQAPNFSKGITTLVTTDTNIIESEIVDVKKSEVEQTVPMISTDVRTNVTERTVTVYHPTKNWYRIDTIISTQQVTTIRTWDETYTVVTTTRTVTPVSTPETIETTILHRGAPGSDGEVISKTSVTFLGTPSYGTPVVTPVSETFITIGEVTTNIELGTVSERTEEGQWVK